MLKCSSGLLGRWHFRRDEKGREKIAGDSMREPFTTNGVSAQHPLDGMREHRAVLDAP